MRSYMVKSYTFVEVFKDWRLKNINLSPSNIDGFITMFSQATNIVVRVEENIAYLDFSGALSRRRAVAEFSAISVSNTPIRKFAS